MMEKLLFLLLLAQSLHINAQSTFFEGRISHKVHCFDSLGNELDGAAIGLGTEMHYFLSGGNYKTLDEKGVLTQLFNSATNKYYFNIKGQIQVLDASYRYPQTGEASLLDEETNILGRNCKKMVIQSEADKTTYYYTDELVVDKDLYQKHHFGNWNLFLHSTNGAMALKYHIIYPTMTVMIEAYEIEALDLSEADFNIESYLAK